MIHQKDFDLTSKAASLIMCTLVHIKEDQRTVWAPLVPILSVNSV